MYKEKRGSFTDRPHEERDLQELRLLDEAIERDIPVLAICRGHQLLNVALGGSVLQHIEDNGHRWTDDGESSWHETAFDAGRLANVYGPDPVKVNSRHHQAITPDRLANGLREVSRSHDGYVEAMESETNRWVVGVQWHPESPEMRKDSLVLFEAFVAACRPD